MKNNLSNIIKRKGGFNFIYVLFIFIIFCSVVLASYFHVGAFVGKVIIVNSEIKLLSTNVFEEEPLIFDVKLSNNGNQDVYSYLVVDTPFGTRKKLVGYLKPDEKINKKIAVLVAEYSKDTDKWISFHINSTNLKDSVVSETKKVNLDIKEGLIGDISSFDVSSNSSVYLGTMNSIVLDINSDSQVKDVILFSNVDNTDSAYLGRIDANKKSENSLLYYSSEESLKILSMPIILYDIANKKIGKKVVDFNILALEPKVSFEFLDKDDSIQLNIKNQRSIPVAFDLGVSYYESVFSFSSFFDDWQRVRLMPNEEFNIGYPDNAASKVKIQAKSINGDKFHVDRNIIKYIEVYIFLFLLFTLVVALILYWHNLVKHSKSKF